MTGILGQLKWESLKKRRKDKLDLYCYIKVLKVKPVYQQTTLSPKLGVLEISTLWHFRLPLLIQMFIKVASSPRLSGIGMHSPILWSHLLKMQRIVLLSSHLWWELGTNSLITGPGEWLSFSPVNYPDPDPDSIGMVRRPSYVVCQHFKTSSPLKPLDQLKPNFIWSLLEMGEQKCVQMVQVTWPRWPPCPYMVKILKNLLLRNQTADDLETWYVALGSRVLPSLFKWWPWVDLDIFYGKVKFGPLCFCMGKR